MGLHGGLTGISPSRNFAGGFVSSMLYANVAEYKKFGDPLGYVKRLEGVAGSNPMNTHEGAFTFSVEPAGF